MKAFPAALGALVAAAGSASAAAAALRNLVYLDQYVASL